MRHHLITVLLMTSLVGRAQHAVYTLEKCHALAQGGTGI